VTRDPRLVTDIDLEPSAAADEGRLLTLLEPRMCEHVPVYEVERAARLQYAARVYSLRHVFGFVILNGEDGRTSEGRKRTWFSLIGRLTLAQLATLEDLCRKKRMRYNAAIVQVFPRAAAFIAPRDREKQDLIREYPTLPQPETSPSAVDDTGSLFPISSESWRDPEEGWS
jgi:hypothetical protein